MSNKNWEKDTQRVRVVNVEENGRNIYVGCQGKDYIIPDGSILYLPKLVIENIKDAVVVDWKIDGEMGKPDAKKRVDRPRCLVVILDDNEDQGLTKEATERKKIVQEMKEDEAS